MTNIHDGYKQTEVGTIPNDWEVKKIKDIAPLQRGFDLPNSELIKGKYPVVYSNGIANYHNVFQVTGPGVVTGRSGTIGSVHYIEENFWPHNTSLWVTGFKKNNPLFIYYLYLYIDLKRFGSGSGVPTLNRNDVHDFRIAFPPTKAEQTAIATALNDADTLISSLEKLIAKKRNIKQGAMQELLKPKDGWEVKKLGEECEIITKGTTPTSVGRDFQSSGINFIKIESLTANGKIIKDKVAYIDTYTNNLFKRSQLKSGDALFSIAGALGRVAIVSDEILPANTNQALAIIRLKKESDIDLKYLFFYLNSNKIQTHILAINVQGAQANLSLQNITDLPIGYPLKTEQICIAQILSDMDAEIEILEKKLEKYKKIKQGMMQNLLTGRIRLV